MLLFRCVSCGLVYRILIDKNIIPYEVNYMASIALYVVISAMWRYGYIVAI